MRGPDDRGVVLACIVLYAAAASLTRPLTGAAAVAVAVPAVAGLVLAGIARPSAGHKGIDPPVRRTAVLWAAVVTLGTGWELAAWLQQPAYNVASYEHPTVSMLLDPVTQAGIPRFAAWCCWVYVGYRMVRR
jgi:hypothetical protein